MCTCDYCLFTNIIKQLNIKETHPEQYNLMESAFVVCESLNTDTCMLSINCQQHLDDKANPIPREIIGANGALKFLNNAVNQHQDLLLKLNQATEDLSLPEIIRQAIRYCFINTEIEIDVCRDILSIINAGDSQLHKMNRIIKLVEARPSRNTPLKEALNSLELATKTLDD